MNRRFSYSILVIILVLALLTVLSGCGPKKKVSTLKRIELEPAQITVTAGGTVQFTAKGYDQNNNEMTGLTFMWSVKPADAGTITQDGKFKAGEKAAECTVVCEVRGVTAEAAVMIIQVTDDYLRAAGEQLVADVQTAWNSFPDASRLSFIFNDQIVPCTAILSSVIYNVLSNVPDFENLYDMYPDSPPEGTCTYETQWYNNKIRAGSIGVNITRSVVDDKDVILFNLIFNDLNGNKIGSSHGKLLYPNANWERMKTIESICTNPPDNLPFTYHDHFDYNDSIELNIEEFKYAEGIVVENINFKGFISKTENYEMIVHGPNIYEVSAQGELHNSNGNANGRLTIDGKVYTFNGNLNLNFSQVEPDFFTGKITTPDAVLDSSIEISYVNNCYVTDPLFTGFSTTLVPNRLTLSGSVQDILENLVLSGSFSLEIKNAANYNLKAPYSEGNIAGIKLDFNGFLGYKDQNQMAGTFSFEEIAFKKFSIGIGYNLTLDGVYRQICLNAQMVDAQKVAVEISSDWGPAAMIMDLTFQPEFLADAGGGFIIGTLTDVSGKVLVQGVEVGRVGIGEHGLVQITYNDGSFETL